MLLTRQQLLTQFDIRATSLEFLINSHQLDGAFQSLNGQRVLEISDKDRFLLESARNSIYSFGYGTVNRSVVHGVHALPFHRFLCLRFLTTPVEEIYEEIFQLGLLESKAYYKLPDLQKAHKRFLSRCPAEIAPLAAERKPPDTDDLKKLFQQFLYAIDVGLYYAEPESVEDLSFYLRFKDELDVLLTTDALRGEVAAAFGTSRGLKVEPDAIGMYRSLFYAVFDITPEDFDAYLPLLKKSDREAKKRAVGKKFVDIMVEMGAGTESKELYADIIRKSMQDFLQLRELKTPQAQQMTKTALDQALKTQDRLDILTGASRNVGKVLERYKIEGITHEPGIITIDDLKEGKRLETNP